MINIREIIEKVGGLTKAAKLFQVPISTIQYWQKKGEIPSWREDMIKNKMNNFYEVKNG